MKVIRWVTAFLVFNLLFALASWLTELYLGWALSLGWWKWVTLFLYIPITFFLAASIATIASLISPNRYRATILIRWYCVACLILGIIYFAIVGFSFSLLQINNLIFLFFVARASSPKSLDSYLQDSGV
jgi:hypothetical protein